MIHRIDIPDFMRVVRNEDYTLTIQKQIAIQTAKHVDQLLLDELYKLYKGKADAVIVINETEFEQFIKKYLPFYLKEIYPILNEKPKSLVEEEDNIILANNYKKLKAAIEILKKEIGFDFLEDSNGVKAIEVLNGASLLKSEQYELLKEVLNE